MELTCRMLADAAQRSQDGKVHVLGGAWDRLAVPSFPATHPSLAVVLVFRVEYTEALTRHDLRLELVKDGQSKGIAAAGHIEVGHPPGLAPGASQSTSTVLTLPFITFNEPGRYEWVVSINGEPKGSVPLEVIEFSDLPGSPRLPGVVPGAPGPPGTS